MLNSVFHLLKEAVRSSFNTLMKLTSDISVLISFFLCVSVCVCVC